MAEILIRATVAYDGTDFFGFQRQASERTVQAVLETALGRLYGRDITVRGAGRTDAGVHARGQVIAFAGDDTVPPDRVALAVRRYLPSDLAVRETGPAPAGFDPRRDAVARRYRYVLVEDGAADPLRDRFAWRVDPGLDRPAMRAALAALPGRHDFGSLCCENGATGSTVRTLHEARLDEAGDRLELVLEAESFLYRQVRCTVGLLMLVGRGRYEPALAGELLAGAPRPPGFCVAPPTGLCLEAVRYRGSRETEDGR